MDRLLPDLLSGDPTAPHAAGTRRPARCPQIQMCRHHGLHTGHLQVVCVCVLFVAFVEV